MFVRLDLQRTNGQSLGQLDFRLTWCADTSYCKTSVGPQLNEWQLWNDAIGLKDFVSWSGFYPSGPFDLKKWDVMWFWDRESVTWHNTLILWRPPRDPWDSGRKRGEGRIYDPRNPAGKQLKLVWSLSATGV